MEHLRLSAHVLASVGPWIKLAYVQAQSPLHGLGCRGLPVVDGGAGRAAGQTAADGNGEEPPDCQSMHGESSF